LWKLKAFRNQQLRIQGEGRNQRMPSKRQEKKKKKKKKKKTNKVVY